jgi:hypothetical protein
MARISSTVRGKAQGQIDEIRNTKINDHLQQSQNGNSKGLFCSRGSIEARFIFEMFGDKFLADFFLTLVSQA